MKIIEIAYEAHMKGLTASHFCNKSFSDHFRVHTHCDFSLAINMKLHIFLILSYFYAGFETNAIEVC